MKADMFRLDGKVVVVIGAGSGIGASVAKGVAQQGGHDHLLGREGRHGRGHRRGDSRRRRHAPRAAWSTSPTRPA